MFVAFSDRIMLIFLFPWTVCAFQIFLDLIKRKPCGLEFASRIQRRLVHEMLILRITACSESMDRHAPDFWTELNNADVGAAGNAVSPLLPFYRYRNES